MLKVLWICNVPIPKVAKVMGKPEQNICGWITGFANSLENNADVDLNICFPILGSKKLI